MTLKPILALFTLLAAAFPAAAEQPVLKGMQTSDEGRGWNAVGKLKLGDRGFCTGALIEPQLVLTAAHCLFDKETGARTEDRQITFQAGWRNGRAEAYRGVRRSVAHPDYIYSGEDEMERVSYDLALIELDQPILLPQLRPFAVEDARPRVGTSVSVVSYAHDRSEAPSIERDCAVLSDDGGALILTCDVDFGSSGAPVFLTGEAAGGSAARVVSVISAKAEMTGRKVSLATPLEAPLAVLREALSRDNPAPKGGAGIRVLSGGGGSGGAKFVRP